MSAPVVAGKSPVPAHFSAVRGVRCSQCRSSHDGVSFNVRLLEGDEEAVEAATSSWDFVIKSQLSSPRWNNSSCMRVDCGPAELKVANISMCEPAGAIWRVSLSLPCLSRAGSISFRYQIPRISFYLSSYSHLTFQRQVVCWSRPGLSSRPCDASYVCGVFIR